MPCLGMACHAYLQSICNSKPIASKLQFNCNCDGGGEVSRVYGCGGVLVHPPGRPATHIIFRNFKIFRNRGSHPRDPLCGSLNPRDPLCGSLNPQPQALDIWKVWTHPDIAPPPAIRSADRLVASDHRPIVTSCQPMASTAACVSQS